MAAMSRTAGPTPRRPSGTSAVSAGGCPPVDARRAGARPGTQPPGGAPAAARRGVSARDEEIDLQLGVALNEIGARLRANGAAQGVGIDVELLGQRGGQLIDLPLVERDDEIDVDGGRGSPAKELAIDPPMVWTICSASRCLATRTAVAMGSTASLTDRSPGSLRIGLLRGVSAPARSPRRAGTARTAWRPDGDGGLPPPSSRMPPGSVPSRGRPSERPASPATRQSAGSRCPGRYPGSAGGRHTRDYTSRPAGSAAGLPSGRASHTRRPRSAGPDFGARVNLCELR